MAYEHASFFAGVGGFDLGLERAGWRTVAFAEIDPAASAVLARHWPDVPNLGDVVALAERARAGERRAELESAELWSGGFPCQDLSVAGARRGLAGERSGLVWPFLDLVGAYRPRIVLIENVPGLLTSHRGRDMAALLGALVDLGYGVAYRVLDARYFGVPQRRRRVFIVGLRGEGDDSSCRLAAERAAEVLGVGTCCERHPGAGTSPGAALAGPVGGGPYGIGRRTEDDPNLVVGAAPDAGRVRAAHGLAGRLDGPAYYRKATKAHGPDDWERWEEDAMAGAMTAERMGEIAGSCVVQALDARRGGPDDNEAQAGHLIAVAPSEPVEDDQLLPAGQDSHRYRLIGNGVVAPVAEWIGRRLMEALCGAE